jgi:hypothetical protein
MRWATAAARGFAGGRGPSPEDRRESGSPSTHSEAKFGPARTAMPFRVTKQEQQILTILAVLLVLGALGLWLI